MLLNFIIKILYKNLITNNAFRKKIYHNILYNELTYFKKDFLKELLEFVEFVKGRVTFKLLSPKSHKLLKQTSTNYK